jgi:hypothetical protein
MVDKEGICLMYLIHSWASAVPLGSFKALALGIWFDWLVEWVGVIPCRV